MKRFFVPMLLGLVLVFSSCVVESMYDNPEEMRTILETNEALFEEAALEAFEYGKSTFISTFEFFRPEGADESLTGLYVFDTENKETKQIESETISALMEKCNVNSLGVKTEEKAKICEFSIGGGHEFYNGIYYAEPDEPVFLNNFSVPLTKDGDGFSYTVENLNYYTEKWSDHFYYFVAKAK